MTLHVLRRIIGLWIRGGLRWFGGACALRIVIANHEVCVKKEGSFQQKSGHADSLQVK